MRTKDKKILVRGIPKGTVADEAKALNAADSEDGRRLVASGTGNLPDWSKEDPFTYWEAVDQRERKYGPACQKISLKLPEAMSIEQGLALITDFAREELGTKPYAYSIRAAEIGRTEPAYADFLVSSRVQDGFSRDEDHFFRRYRTALPAFSGCRKDGQGLVRGNTTEPSLTRLQNWKRLCTNSGGKKP